MRPNSLLFTAGLCTLLTACVTVAPRQLCASKSDMARLIVPAPDDWYALLLHGFNREKGVAPSPALDCASVPVMWQEPQAEECREPGPEARPLPPPERLTDEDIVVERLEGVHPDLRLVWIVARRFANGEGLGPVALVERTPQGFVVKAMGSLRAYPEQARLRLEYTKEYTKDDKKKDAQLLVVEGQTCTEDAEPVCRRMVRVLPRREDRFFSEPVTSSDGSCLGPAWFPLSREAELVLPSGTHRKVEFTSTLSVKPEGIVLDEQVVMSNVDPDQPSMPPLPYSRSQAQRVLLVTDTGLVGTKPSLWVQVLEPELQAGAKPVEAARTAEVRPPSP